MSGAGNKVNGKKLIDKIPYISNSEMGKFLLSGTLFRWYKGYCTEHRLMLCSVSVQMHCLSFFNQVIACCK